jgi:hypothetical protein
MPRFWRLPTRTALALLPPLAHFCTLESHPTNADLPATRPESSGYAETSRYEDVLEFLRAVTGASPRIHLTQFG